jgi:membrane protein implicated in regulation of membrane protease activity
VWCGVVWCGAVGGGWWVVGGEWWVVCAVWCVVCGVWCVVAQRWSERVTRRTLNRRRLSDATHMLPGALRARTSLRPSAH